VHKEIAFKWASALRASPELQTQNLLAEEGGFCALGMLCKVYCDEVKDISGKCVDGYIIGFWDISEADPSRTAVLQNLDVPNEVILWSGIGPVACRHVAQMNDGSRKYVDMPRTFPQIADFIEANHETL